MSANSNTNSNTEYNIIEYNKRGRCEKIFIFTNSKTNTNGNSVIIIEKVNLIVIL